MAPRLSDCLRWCAWLERDEKYGRTAIFNELLDMVVKLIYIFIFRLSLFFLFDSLFENVRVARDLVESMNDC